MSLIQKLKNLLFVDENKKKVLNKKLLRWAILLFLIPCVVLVLLSEKKQNTVREKINIDVDSSQANRIHPESLKGSEGRRIDNYKADLSLRKSASRSSSGILLAGPEFISRPGSSKIPPGTVVKAILENGATDGPIKARLLEDVTVMGNVVFEIRSIALDSQDQTLGLPASQFGNESIKLGASIGLNFVSGLSEGLKEKINLNGAVTDTNSSRNAFLNGTEKASLEYSRDLMNEVKNKKRQLFVEKGTEILVFFD